MKRFILAALVGVLVSGCASGVGGSNPPEGITVSDAKMVANCTFVSDVHGTSPFYGVFVNAALTDARQVAMKEAKKLGATHVVFTTTATGHGSTAASGQAYRC